MPLNLGVKGSQVQILSARLGSRGTRWLVFPTMFPAFIRIASIGSAQGAQ